MITITLFDTTGEPPKSRKIEARLNLDDEPKIVVDLPDNVQLMADLPNARALYQRIGYQLSKLQVEGAA